MLLAVYPPVLDRCAAGDHRLHHPVDAFLHEVRKQADEADMRAALANIGAELSARLEEGKSVALGMVLTEEGLAVQEVAADDKTAEVISIVITKDGVLASDVVVTEEGAAYAVAAVTEDATEYEVGVVTEEGTAVEHGLITEEGALIADVVVTEDEAVGDAVVVTPVEEATEETEAAGQEEEQE